jgi:thiamine biosynthesis protein ThiC
MMMNACENPFLENFDKILAISRKHDVVLSLGNTAPSGCIHDPRDALQLDEVALNVMPAQQALASGVQVIIEGAGGHIRSDRIPEYIRYYKSSRLSRSSLPARFPKILLSAMIILPVHVGAARQRLPGQIISIT